MRWLHKLLMQCNMLLRRDQAGEQLHDELQFHLDQHIAENISRGMSPVEARSAALRSFGNPATLRDQVRDTWSWQGLELLLSDIRYGLRTLVRTPGFSVLAIVVMGLGIGANVALFTVVHSVLLKPLPFKDQSRLVRLYEANVKGAYQDNVLAGGTYASWQAQAHSFEGMAIKRRVSYDLSGSAGELPELADAEQASWNIFALLGVDAAVGRVFLPSDDRPQANATVILSWGLWKRRYGGDPDLIEKTILLDARPFTVIGILPAWFIYPDSKIQMWTPIYREQSPAAMALHTAHNLDAIARLKPGVTIDQATAELDTIQRQIRRQFPDGPVNDAANIRPILEGEVFRLQTGLYAMFGPLPHFAAVLFQDGSIAKSHARLPLGFLPAHPFAHELLGAFLYMQSHLFREVIVEFAAAEEIWNPVHGRLLLTGWGFARIEDKRDTFEHASEAGNLLLKMPKT